MSARPLAVARIGVSAAMLLELRQTADAMLLLAEPGTLRAPYWEFGPSPTVLLVWALIALWLASAAALMIGWRTRAAGAVLTVTLASVLLLDQQLYSNHDYLMVLVAGLLTVGDSGATLSLDARRRGARESIPAWPVWLLKVQISFVYGFAALAKLNVEFLSGSVVASYLRREGPLAFPDAWRTLEPMMVLAILAIGLEAFVALSLWSRRWRPAGMVAAFALHIGITGWLSPTYALLVFSLLMLPMLLLFLDVTPGHRVVVWDDSCGFCAGWVRWLRRLDWLRALDFVPCSRLGSARLPVSEEAALEALQLVTPRRVYAGFRAVTRVAEVLPVSFLWAPLLRLPPVVWLGDRVYAKVAARRTCQLPVGTARAAPSSRSS
jgi:predicted DCC family thiol-disulfide oxidoreductase YuxK